MTSITFPLRPGKPPVEFKFTAKYARQMERAAGAGIPMLLVSGRTVDALALLVCYGLKHMRPNMTEDKAIDWIQTFIDNGGNVRELSEAVMQAMNASGVYGPSEPAEESAAADDDDEDGPAPPAADPTLTTTSEATVSAGTTGPAPSPSDD
jgi:hypothetical protein